MYLSKKFQMYNYGSASKNMEHYGQVSWLGNRESPNSVVNLKNVQENVMFTIWVSSLQGARNNSNNIIRTAD